MMWVLPAGHPRFSTCLHTEPLEHSKKGVVNLVAQCRDGSAVGVQCSRSSGLSLKSQMEVRQSSDSTYLLQATYIPTCMMYIAAGSSLSA